MAKNVTLMGASYPDVPAVNLPQTGGGTARFTDTSGTTATASDVAQGKVFYAADGTETTGTASGGSATIESLSVTANGTYTAPSGVDGYSPVVVNVPTGGGGGGTLILTQALGALTSSSSTERDTGISITVPGSEVNKYDVLFVATSVDDIKLGFHICTLRTILLQGSSNRNQKNNFSLIPNLLNYRASSDGTEITYQGTTVYGVFPVSPSLDSTTQDLTFGMHYRYSASQSGKINGTYTTRVYGVKLTELMGV